MIAVDGTSVADTVRARAGRSGPGARGLRSPRPVPAADAVGPPSSAGATASTPVASWGCSTGRGRVTAPTCLPSSSRRSCGTDAVLLEQPADRWPSSAAAGSPSATVRSTDSSRGPGPTGRARRECPVRATSGRAPTSSGTSTSRVPSTCPPRPGAGAVPTSSPWSTTSAGSCSASGRSRPSTGPQQLRTTDRHAFVTMRSAHPSSRTLRVRFAVAGRDPRGRGVDRQSGPRGGGAVHGGVYTADPSAGAGAPNGPRSSGSGPALHGRGLGNESHLPRGRSLSHRPAVLGRSFTEVARQQEMTFAVRQTVIDQRWVPMPPGFEAVGTSRTPGGVGGRRPIRAGWAAKAASRVIFRSVDMSLRPRR